jgi:uncharacterized protein (TIGR02145 family)
MQNKIWAVVPAALLSLCLSTSVWGEEEYLPFIPLLLSGPTYTVTPSAVGSGFINPSTVQRVEPGETISFTLSTTTENTVIGSVGGTCGGSLDDTGTIYTTDPITQDCTVAANKVWMDSNLGATRVAISDNDELAYGDLYQWGRGTDDHEKRDSDTTTTLSNTDTPGQSFIITFSSPYDWRVTQKDSLWQGVTGTNNPCPAGFRLPTESEWQTEIDSWSSQDSTGAFNSPLKLVVGGYRSHFSGGVSSAGNSGNYWSGTVIVTEIGNLSRGVGLGSDSAYVFNSNRAYGRSVRCIED